MNQQNKKGRFITLEGGEGAGKSTAAARIQSLLEKASIPVVVTREPGGNPLAEAIRETTLADWSPSVPAKAELLLMFAARCAHVEQKIQPALEAGSWVICDRFVDASYAYQGIGRGLGLETVQWLDDWVLDGFSADRTYLLDVTPEIGLARAKSRGDTNRFEREDISFAEAVRKTYLDRAANAPDRFQVIDVTQPLEQVVAAIEQDLKPLIEQWQSHQL